MTEESFKILLENLKLNSNESGAAYTDLRNSLVRYFQIKGDFDADEAADATLDRVAMKLAQNIKIENLTKYSFGVARLIFLERLRIAGKNKIAQTEFYSDQNIGKTPDLAFFRECFNNLVGEDKEMLTEYFADLSFSELMTYREKIAVKYKTSISNLRLKVFRLKKRLEDCLKNKLT